MMAEKLVIIGAGMASGRMLETLLDVAPGVYDITLFNGETRGNYNRLMLSPVLSGEKTYEQIVTHDDAWYAANDITTRFGEAVVKIDRARQVVISVGGETPYDKLVIATGSAPFIIPVPGHKLPGVVTYRDLEDTNAMIAAARPGAKAVVIGPFDGAAVGPFRWVSVAKGPRTPRDQGALQRGYKGHFGP
jgi:nitrite reductase (NADH) large subunit